MEDIEQTADASKDAQHLCVLIHGFWGSPDDLKVMARILQEKHPNLHILIAKRNSGNFTYDGIEMGGERVCQEIEEEIKDLFEVGFEVKKISLVGYSLGGLIARYAVGLLYSKGFFKNIQPLNFVTFVSPHLGVRAPLRGWQNSMWNVIGAHTLLTSGWQLFMIDKFRDTGRPLLEILADPSSIFIKGLSKFQQRTLYTNIVNDRSAVYYTTSISKTDPFTNVEKLKINYLKGYEDIILDPESRIESPEEPDLTPSTKVLKRTQTIVKRLPFLLALVSYIPIGMLEVLINSGLEALKSNRRIKDYERGLSPIQPNYYRVPLLITTGIQGAVEGVYKNVNSAQSHEYLPRGSPEESFVEDLEQNEGPPTPLSEVPPPHAQILALSPAQFKMIHTLNKLGWRKYQVHIHEAKHSHAAVIVRTDKPSFDEGRIVLKHWVEEEFIV